MTWPARSRGLLLLAGTEDRRSFAGTPTRRPTKSETGSPPAAPDGQDRKDRPENDSNRTTGFSFPLFT